MAAEVAFDPLQFFRQFFGLGLYPPKAQYGMGIPPLHDGGWWLMAGLSMTLSLWSWWIRVLAFAGSRGLGTDIGVELFFAISFVMCIGIIDRLGRQLSGKALLFASGRHHLADPRVLVW